MDSNLHELLKLTRPLIIFDLETTGVDTEKDRIVEFGFQIFTDKGMVKEFACYVNPGISIPPEVTKIHGITDEMVRDAILFASLGANVVKHFQNCDFGGKNVRFDLRMFETEMRRAQIPWDYTEARILDAERFEQLAVPRHLSDLYKKYTGLDHTDAHGALADVKASAAVLFHQLLQHPDVLPRDLDKLHELSWPGRIDVEGKFIFRNGIAVCTFGKYRNQSMRRIAPDYWRYIINNDFSAEIKALAENALKGIYPETKA